MKKNFLTAAAFSVAAFFAASTIAQAADVTFGGQIMTRYEVNEQSDFSASTDADDFIQSRVRLNADVNVNDSTSAFIQLHSARTWGAAPSAGSVAGTQGSGNASFTPSDADASVGIHQAYFTLKNFATLPVDMKVGRQEIIIDGHRLFGNTVWTVGQQTHDAVLLTHAHDNMSLVYAYITAIEDGAPTGTNLDDKNDVSVQVANFNYQGVLGGAFTATYAYVNDGCGFQNGTQCDGTDNDIHNIGFRQAGQLFGIDYRGEYNYQFGDGRGTANSIGASSTAQFNNPGNTTFDAQGQDIDRSAYMFGVRVGKSFQNVTLKPKLTLWYDYLSGTSNEDQRSGNVGSFNTLFDTGHKYYGLMDNYLTVGAGSGTDGLGLQDIAIKTQISPMPGWTLKADYHWFYTAEGYAATSDGIGDNDNDLGNELDVTLVNKYNANTKILLGYSNYSATATYRNIKGLATGSDSADWAYVMIDVQF